MKNPIRGTVAYLATAALLKFAEHANPKMLSRGHDAQRVKRYIAAGADVTATNRDGEPLPTFSRGVIASSVCTPLW